MTDTSSVWDHVWIPITIAAALFQCLRTMVQKRMAANLSTNANTFTRYGFGLPIVVLYLGLVALADPAPLPALNLAFVVNCVIGGAAQIAATSLLILAFTSRSYAVAIALSKTEAVQAAVFAAAILGERLSPGGIVALITIAVGVMAMSSPPGALTWSLRFDRAVVYGLLSGTLFGITAVSIRGANLALDGGFLPSAAMTLAIMVTLQAITLGAYVARFEPLQIGGLIRAWRGSLLVGLLSALGSISWFTGMALEKAAYVRTLGQVELVFTVLASRYYFHEALRRREAVGIALIVGGILILLIVA